MTSKHHFHVAALIPPHLTPTEVIAALHDHQTCLTLQALTTKNEKLPETAPETLKDTYWYPPDLNPITTYAVTECITLIPGVGEWAKKYITFPSCFQDTPQGVKTRADAPGGVSLRAEFRVIRGDMIEAEVVGEGEGVGMAEWVLAEDVEVSCSWWMMPFVRGKMEQAHSNICKLVVEKVEKRRVEEGIRREVERGRMSLHRGKEREEAEKWGSVDGIKSVGVRREWKWEWEREEEETKNGNGEEDSRKEGDKKADPLPDKIS